MTGKEIIGKKIINKKTIRRSPWISFFDTGSCNGCMLECVACTTPRYDIERFGCLFKESAKHADILVITGIVNEQCKKRMVNIYEQMADPKVVVAVGSCALSGGAFSNSYNFAGPLDKVLPVDVYIPGCPPRPETIIDGLLKALDIAKDGRKKGSIEENKKKGKKR